jgi:exopolyphosphatase/guanosine-5'-triphosphate,3'-diphosphate pyrophosphatase
MKFAAIDIGSNAVRLLLARVFENPDGPFIKKESLVRIPLRLGDDAFLRKIIPQEKINRLSNTMLAFKYLIDAYEPLDYMACATSAMREADNSAKIIHEVSKYSGLKLEVIDGKQEANIIFSTHIEEKLNPDTAYLYIDVGGGSTELTLFHKNQPVEERSFNIGTIRLLNNLVSKKQWNEFKQWTKTHCSNYDKISAIGSGGNINKIFRLSGKKENSPVTYKKLLSISKSIRQYTFEERIYKLGLRPDRADVILPASKIFTSIMRWGNINHIYVPQIGLADGLVHILYQRYKS